jgi:RNA polymerase sigma-70 factor (ECF subfamily)
MTWWRNSSRHPDPQAKAAQQRRHNEVIHALADACEQRDPELIARLLAPDAELVIDGGGVVWTPAPQTKGGRATSDLIVGILARYPLLTLEEHPVNGAPAILLRDDRALVGVISVGVGRETISHIWVVLNPEKLVHFDYD